MIKTVSEEVFKNTEGVSYSRLSKLAESPQAYQAGLVDDPESSAISIGSAVDIKLTEPDKFDEQIYVMSTKKPNSEAMLAFCNVYAETGDFAQAYIASGYQINEKRVADKFDAEGKDYHDALLASKGKKIIDIEDLFKVNQIVNTLQNNPFTKKYFVAEDGIELVFQPRILWDIDYTSLLDGKSKSVQAKSVLDIIRIDHKNKIIQPLDIKTGGEGFMKSYWRYKRYLQGSMYHMALVKELDDAFADDYTIENFRFIFADTNLWYPPTIYQMSFDDLTTGIHGRKTKAFAGMNIVSIAFMDDMWKAKGYIQLASELEWHQKMNQWDYSYDVYQRNGEIDVDAFTFKF